MRLGGGERLVGSEAGSGTEHVVYSIGHHYSLCNHATY